MEWLDRGYVLSVRLHGESALIVSILTEENGRHPGLIRGGGSAKRRGLYQPGNFLEVNWRARLPDHLGTYSCELTRAHSADFLDTPNKLLAVCSAVTLLDNALPERQPAPEIFGSFGLSLYSPKSPVQAQGTDRAAVAFDEVASVVAQLRVAARALLLPVRRHQLRTEDGPPTSTASGYR